MPSSLNELTSKLDQLKKFFYDMRSGLTDELTPMPSAPPVDPSLIGRDRKQRISMLEQLMLQRAEAERAARAAGNMSDANANHALMQTYANDAMNDRRVDKQLGGGPAAAPSFLDQLKGLFSGR